MLKLNFWQMPKKDKERKMTALDVRVKMIVNQLDPEFRIPVVNALKTSDGTLLSFHQELISQSWETPNLEVDNIIDLVAYDAD